VVYLKHHRFLGSVDSFLAESLMTIESTFTNDAGEPVVYTVSELNRVVSELLALELGTVWLRGEVSSLTRAASGHLYISLKDDQAVVRAVMFRGRLAYCAFAPAVGDEVEVQAKVGLYEPRGDFQLNVQALRRAGRGSLHEQFELLKTKLQAEGLFDSANKRAIRPMPRSVGIITSLGAAALHDVLTTLARRAPHVGIIVYPTLVQGQTAPLAIRQALASANARAEVDTLLLVRGGGSIEDLWAFNDENLARDIASSVIAVIVGVGHESDTTIADFVGDLRAPTPTAAAELCCVAREDLVRMVATRKDRLMESMSRMLERRAQRVDRLSLRMVSPSQRIAARGHQFALLRQRMAYAKPILSVLQNRLEQAAKRLNTACQQQFLARRWHAQTLDAKLQSLSPLAPLERGFAIVRAADGQIVHDATRLTKQEQISISFAQGQVRATVDAVLAQPETRSTKQD